MKEFFQKNHRLVFYGMWLLLGILQSGLTELQDDEAYYWVYAHTWTGDILIIHR